MLAFVIPKTEFRWKASAFKKWAKMAVKSNTNKQKKEGEIKLNREAEELSVRFEVIEQEKEILEEEMQQGLMLQEELDGNLQKLASIKCGMC